MILLLWLSAGRRTCRAASFGLVRVSFIHLSVGGSSKHFEEIR